jgi:hypothetical protein
MTATAGDRAAQRRAASKTYREANREKIRASSGAYREANREKVRTSSKTYREANREKVRSSERARRAANRTQMRDQTLKSRHGMTPSMWAAMWEAQDGRCYLCQEPMTPESADVDHDHTCCAPPRSCSNCRRGLAHKPCNTAIGILNDDPDLMRKIAANLEAVLGPVRDRIAAKPYQANLFDTETA